MRTVAVKRLDELEVGSFCKVTVDQKDILLVRLEDGVFATSDICTHALVSLSGGWLEGNIICCPKHGGKFDARTGKAVAFPAVTGLKTYRTSVVDGQVMLEV
ncbi:Rieske (2Fe-2S) protein [Ferroacidibacillus organovorans]|uniref:Rieske domain-containing protein n=1 Tax=Ferroacidibacillus organovorans TaxID=1765683 RepID=A0A101XP68_9BACL|nr:non-heme iron oxygenase ferredoxin subunit [Ferroacidibacillus organovorans]KUO94992.1 hypothetical protein ATW55_04985 [Ferroacidibacillus organovorans]